MQWQKEYFYPWKLFKIFFSMESFRKNNPCANGFEKEKDAMRVVLILEAASRALYKHNYFF